ncbi:MAG: hypothetical protein O3A46_05965 [Candidatus Poribacteria bacterium]|nr:hypothetical protein [Candidatus Poribacteria bacterium]
MKRLLLVCSIIAILITGTGRVSAQATLENEAGICAYFNAGKPVNLDFVRDRFRTIESDTGDYLIGSFPLPEYTEDDDPHVYFSRDGWVAAYYLKDDPVAKIVDLLSWAGGKMERTKLDIALSLIGEAAGFSPNGVKYYYFPAPQANRMLIAADMGPYNQQTNEFSVLIPSDTIVYERSVGGTSNVLIGETRIERI